MHPNGTKDQNTSRCQRMICKNRQVYLQYVKLLLSSSLVMKKSCRDYDNRKTKDMVCPSMT